MKGYYKLLIEDSEHVDLLFGFVREMNGNIVTSLSNIINELLINLTEYDIKLIRQSGRPAIHIGTFSESSSDVIAWIQLNKSSLHLWLRTGTDITDLWNDINMISPNSTPHSVIARNIHSEDNIDNIIELIRRSEFVDK
jgi:hypothetical protein